jgi:hypothetical protein
VIALTDFDPVVVEQYGITEEKVAQVAHYVRLLQGKNAPTLHDIATGGYYGTSALLHEVVELEVLLARKPDLLQLDATAAIEFFWTNLDAHACALVEEYRYLQATIERVFGEQIGLGALVMVNADQRDFELLVESSVQVPIFEPTISELDHADRLVKQMRALGREMPR